MDKSIHKSGLVKKELFLLKSFVKEPWKEFTISEIRRISKNKSYHYVFEALKKFTSLGILEEKKGGNANIYFVDKNDQSVRYLALLELLMMEERADIPYKNILKITDRIKNPFFTVVVCGSYAEKKQKSASDLDIAFIIPDGEPKKPYEIALREGELIIPEVHGLVFTREEMYLMLTNKEFNYGKELARKHIMVYGAEAYYRILFEAIRHGFNG